MHSCFFQEEEGFCFTDRTDSFALKAAKNNDDDTFHCCVFGSSICLIFFSLFFPSFTKNNNVVLEHVFASLPQMERGVAKVIGGDPKGNNFLYTNGKCVIIRNIDVRRFLILFFSLYPVCHISNRLSSSKNLDLTLVFKCKVIKILLGNLQMYS